MIIRCRAVNVSARSRRYLPVSCLHLSADTSTYLKNSQFPNHNDIIMYVLQLFNKLYVDKYIDIHTGRLLVISVNVCIKNDYNILDSKFIIILNRIRSITSKIS